MKQIFLSAFIAILGLTFVADDAQARRFGGGGGSGMKRAAPPKAAPKQNVNRPPQAPASTPAGRSWTGPLMGLAAGLGLAALFSHLGLGEEMAGFFMILLLVAAGVLIFKLLRRRAGTPAQGLQYAGASAGGAQYGNTGAVSSLAPAASSASSASNSLAEEFDAEAFVRQAKLNFIRLQNANDAGDLDDIRTFTTPEMYAEASMQITERGGVAQKTDVLELDAEVVEVVEEDGRYIVSVRFGGLLREEKDAPPAPFDETWHLVKSVKGDEGWRVAGIQQNA